MNNSRTPAPRIGDGGFKTILLENRFAYITFNVLSFTLTALITYYLSGVFGGNQWFSIIFGVSLGMLAFCAVRIWLDEDSFDDPGTKSYIILSGTLSFVGIILAYVTLGMYPFGEHTVLIIDMHHQYVAFFSLLRNKIMTGGSLLYSDDLGLGSGFLPLFAYYLSSPFNIIALLFPRDNITEAIELITILKITAGGVTSAIFAKYMFRRNDFLIVVCGVMYSLMSFFICHSWNIMWLDSLVLLPLTFLGLSKLLHEGKPALYCICLALTLISNYYIGYMICIFLVVCYFAFVIADTRGLPAYDRAQRFWRFCYGSLIGGGLSAFMTVPAFIYLRLTYGAEDKFARSLATNFNLFSLVQRMLYGSYPSMRGDDYPNVYCTVLAFFLFVLFAMCASIPLRRRVAWCGAAAFIAVCMSVNWTNFAWHGFHFPSDLPYRFSFLFSFTLIFIAIQLLGAIDKVKTKEAVKAALLTVVLIFIEQQLGDGKATFSMIYGSIAFVALYALVVVLRTSGRIRKAFCYALILLIVFAEAGSNTSLLLYQLDKNEFYTERNDFVVDYEIKHKAVDTVSSYGDDMYRMEIIPRKTCNDPSLFGYSGMTVFASSNRKSVTTLMGKLGYAVNGVNSYLYKNFTPVTDSLLGLKYIVLNKEINGHKQLTPIDEITADSELDSIVQSQTNYIHVNNSALERAFMVNKSILGWEWDSSNPFIVQNSLISTATGLGDVYTPVYFYRENGSYDFYDDESYNPVSSSDAAGDTGLSISEFNCTLDVNGTFFTSVKSNEALNSSFTITQALKVPGQYYVYVDCRAAESISVTTTASDGTSTTITSSPNEPNIIDLGYMDKNSSVAVNFDSEITCSGNVFLARLNQDVFDQAIEQLKTSQLNADVYKEGYISGTVNAAQDGMMFTSIPYDAGWTVKIDGRKVSTFPLGDALLCFAVPQGTHSVTMSYFPKGVAAGLIISLLFLFILLVLCIPKWRSKAGEIFDNYILEPARQRRLEKLREKEAEFTYNDGEELEEPEPYDDDKFAGVQYDDDMDDDL